MAISSDTRKAGPFNGNDVTTVFPFAFKVFEASDLWVVLQDALGVESDLVLDDDYSVELNGDQDNDPGGSITLGAALATDECLTITSNVLARQPLVLTTNGGFYPRVINNAFDRITIIAQQLIEQVGRSLKLPISSTADPTLPAPTPNGVIAWNSTGDGFTNISLGDLTTVSGYADARVEVYTGDGVQTDFDLDFHPGVLANLDVSVAGVTQTAGVDFTWAGTVVTFTTAPPDDTTIQIRYARPLAPVPNFDDVLTAVDEAQAAAAQAAIDAGIAAAAAAFTALGTGALTRSYISKMRDIVSDADYTTLQEALTAAAGKTLHIVTNRVIAAALTVPDGTKVVFAGGTVTCMTTGMSAFIAGNDTSFYGLVITGPGSLVAEGSFANGNGIYGLSKKNIKVERCQITGWQTNGVLFSNCSNVTIDGNTFHDNKYTSGSGADITFYSGTAGNRHKITNNFCLSNNSQGIFYNALGADADATITNNVCVALDAAGVEFVHLSTAAGNVRRHAILASYNGGANAGRTVVGGNVCRNTAWSGVYVQNATLGSGVIVSGNYCSNNGYDLTNTLSGGIFVNSLGDELIEGNYIDGYKNSSNGVGGLTLGRGQAGTSGLAVRGNMVVAPAAYGMYVSGFLKDADITGNKIIDPANAGVVIVLSATAGDHGGLNFDGNTIIRRSGNAPGVDFAPGGGTTRSRFINNKIIGWDGANFGTWNTAISIRNGPVEIRNNTFRGWYYGVSSPQYFSLATRYFEDVVIDGNTFEGLHTGVGIGTTSGTSTLPICNNIFRGVTAKASGGPLSGAQIVYIAERQGDKIVVFDRTAAPTTGTWAVGDVCRNSAPTIGGISQWECTTAGNPGTWSPNGIVGAIQGVAVANAAAAPTQAEFNALLASLRTAKLIAT